MGSLHTGANIVSRVLRQRHERLLIEVKQDNSQATNNELATMYHVRLIQQLVKL